MKKLIFSLILLFIIFFIAEAGLRVIFAFKVGPSVLWYGTSFFTKEMSAKTKMGKWKDGSEITVGHHDNKSANYSKYFPNQVRHDTDETGKRFRVMINSRGFRGKDFDDQKQPDFIRIVTLGASSTFGFNDRDNETYPYYMEQILNKKSNGNKEFEVINLGIPHLTTDNIYSLFINEALPLNPDIVTFYEGVNDTVVKNPKGDIREQAKRVPILRSISQSVRNHLILISFLDSLTNKPVRRFTQQAFNQRIEGKSEHFLENLSKIRKECQKRGILFIVANQQVKSYLIEREDIKGITYQQEEELVKKKLSEEGKIKGPQLAFLVHCILMEDLRKWALTNNVQFVDVIEALDQDRDALLSWVHLSPKGNRVVADAFVKEIMQNCPLVTRQKTPIGLSD